MQQVMPLVWASGESRTHPVQVLFQLIAAAHMKADGRRVQIVQVAHILVHLCLQWRLQAPHLRARPSCHTICSTAA